MARNEPSVLAAVNTVESSDDFHSMPNNEQSAQECDATDAQWMDEPLVHKKP